MNSVRNLALCLALAGCATTAPVQPQQPCAPLTVVQDTACKWVLPVRPTKAEVAGTMPHETLQQITASNNAIKANCPAAYEAWKAALPAWQ